MSIRTCFKNIFDLLIFFLNKKKFWRDDLPMNMDTTTQVGIPVSLANFSATFIDSFAISFLMEATVLLISAETSSYASVVSSSSSSSSRNFRETRE